MEKIDSRREFMDSEFQDPDDVLDYAYFSRDRDETTDLDEDESNYDYRESEFRSISEL